MRFARNRSNSGEVVLSCFETAYQEELTNYHGTYQAVIAPGVDVGILFIFALGSLAVLVVVGQQRQAQQDVGGDRVTRRCGVVEDVLGPRNQRLVLR